MKDGRQIAPQLGPIDNYWINADGRVAGDIPCRHCRYNLRTLSTSGDCPECGRPIADSEPLYHRPLAWLRQLRLGAAMLPLSMVAGVVGAVAISSVSGRWPKGVGQTWRPDAWFYGVLWLGQTLPMFIFLGGILILTAYSPTDKLPFRRSLRFLLIAYMPVWLWGATAEALCGRISLELGRMMSFVAAVLLAMIVVLLLMAVRELLQRVPRPRLAQIGLFLVFLTVAYFAVISLVTATSLIQTIVIDEPQKPYAFETSPVDASGQPTLTTAPAATHYIIVDESGGMTRTTTVPAHLLAEPKQWPQWVVDLSSISGRLAAAANVPMFVYVVGMFVFLSLAWWHICVAVRRRVRLEAPSPL